MALKMITEAQIRKWANPRAKDEMIKGLAGAEKHLRAAGILDNNLRLCHFMGQVGAETDGLRIMRENMNYTSARRISQVWRARTRRSGYNWVARNLVRNPKRLSAWAYGGRMGNARWPSLDGYNFRGGGYIQTTGRYHVTKYAKALNIPVTPDLLDRPEITIQFACFEWDQSGCNKFADENDLYRISKIINTGSAYNNVRPNGMNHRKHWYRKAWEAWGDQKHKEIPEVSDLTVADLAAKGSETIKAAQIMQRGAIATIGTGAAVGASEELGVKSPAEVDIQVLDSLKGAGESATIVNEAVSSISSFVEFAFSHFWLLVLVVGVVGLWASRHVIKRRLTDARMGLNLSRIL
jgi:putative chitinase